MSQSFLIKTGCYSTRVTAFKLMVNGVIVKMNNAMCEFIKNINNF